MLRAFTAALALALSAPAMPARADEPAVEVSPAVAELLQRVQDAAARRDIAAALAAVDGWTGPPHPLVDLARGHAYALADRYEPAIAAYRAALAADPKLRSAGLGLIGALARREQWAAVCAEMPSWHDPATADLSTMRLWLAAAIGADDPMLAEEIARRAVVRWPDEARFRRGLAHALLETDRPAAAAAVIRRLLSADPADAELWQQLARTAADPVAARPALEAAVLADPSDQPRRVRLVEAQLAAGHAPAALAYARPLGATPLAIRAAVAAGDIDQAATWLAEVPAAKRDPTLRRLAARVALARGDRDTARNELAALLAGGDADVGVLVQLAALERDAGALDRAEALLRQAAVDDSPAAGLAVAHLAHLLLRRGRRDEAAAVLRRHLVEHPADATARDLLGVAGG